MHRHRRRERLAPVQVTERDVVGVRREDRRGHRVLEDRLGGPLAAAERAAEHRQVRHHEVHRIRAEPGGQRADQGAHVLVVRAGVLRRGLGDQLRGAHRVALGQERQHRDRPTLPAPGGELDDAAGLGRPHRPHEGDPRGPGEGPVRVEGGRVVVVPRDHDDLRLGARQGHQRADHEALRGRAGRGAVVEVAGHEHGVDLLLPRDPHDLAQHLLLLVEPAEALQRLADVPVGRVENSHGRHRRGAHRQFRRRPGQSPTGRP